MACTKQESAAWRMKHTYIRFRGSGGCPYIRLNFPKLSVLQPWYDEASLMVSRPSFTPPCFSAFVSGAGSVIDFDHDNVNQSHFLQQV